MLKTLVLAVGCLVFATAARADVPTCIHIQGVLTDTAGTPEPAGLKVFTFRIFDADSAGAKLWPAGSGEEQTLTTAADGLWNACVGEEIPLSPDLFGGLPRWLEIEVDDGTSPPEVLGRLELHTSPFAFQAATSEAADSLSPTGLTQVGSSFVRISGDTLSGPMAFDFGSDANNDLEVRSVSGPAANVAMYDNDTLRTFLWGQDYGEVDLYDGNGSLGAALMAGLASGGQLRLNKESGAAGVVFTGGTTTDGSTFNMRNAAGAVTVSADADLTGNTAFVAPQNSISAAEVLDEPGLAYVTAPGEVTLSSSISTLTSRSLTVPTSGYILVLATMFFRVQHTTGNSTVIFYDAPNVPGTFVDGDWLLWESGLPTGTRIITQTIHRIYTVGAGTHTFYVTARVSSGAAVIGDIRLTPIFIPTAYGTIAAASASSPLPGQEPVRGAGSLSSAELASERAASERTALERLESELTVMRQERNALETRVEQLEGAVLGGQTPVRAGEEPRP